MSPREPILRNSPSISSYCIFSRKTKIGGKTKISENVTIELKEKGIDRIQRYSLHQNTIRIINRKNN